MSRNINVALISVAMLLAGCSSLPVAHIQSTPLPQKDNVTFTDQRTSPSEPTYMLGEGSLYSCHYGISRLKEEAIVPDRMTLLHAYLDNEVFKGDKPRSVVVTRFDIYWNRHAASEQNMFGGFWTPGSVVGCKDADEGEYSASEVVNAQVSPIVIYLYLTIDGKEYKVRNVYPSPSESESITTANWSQALSNAVNQSFDTLGKMVMN